MKINPKNCYTSYVVTTGSARNPRYLTAPAYSPNTAVFSRETRNATLFSTFNKAASCADNITDRSGGDVMTYIVPVSIERRRKRS